MSEINAAFGLLQLQHVDHAIECRQEISQTYDQYLKSVKGIRVVGSAGQMESNYSYYPVLVSDDYPLSRDELYYLLRDQNIYARRYFYPLISDFPMYRAYDSAQNKNIPVAKYASERVICLPLYPGLSRDDQSKVIKIIISNTSYGA
jgi:dTDP-4-amino-4,6-dideoxygalactose transaminase